MLPSGSAVRCWVGAVASVLCCGGQVFAEEKPRVAVVPFFAHDGAKDVHAQRFSGLLIEELKTREEIAAVPLGAGASAVKLDEPAASPAAKEAQAAITEGKKQVADLQFEAGATLLKKGIEQALGEVGSADFALLVDAQMSLAVAQFRLGEEKAAQNALSWVARLDPQYALPEGRYPPVFLREFDKAKKRVEKLNKSALTVEGPQGAEVFLNGKELGRVPATAAGLPTGVHYVRLRGKNGERASQSVDLRSQAQRVKLSFGAAVAVSPASEVKAQSVLDEPSVARYSAAAKAAGADFLVVGVLYRSGEHQLTAAAALFGQKAQAFTRLKSFTFDDELSTANVEAFRLADAATERAVTFGAPALLPLDLIGKDVRRPAVAAITGAEPDVALVPKVAPLKVPLKATDPSGESPVEKVVEQPVEKVATAKDVTLEKPKQATLVPSGEDGDGYRPLGRESVMVDAQGQGPGRSGQGDDEVKKGLPWWVYVAGGVGAAALLGGTYLGVTQASRPVTGTVTARW